MTTAAFGMALKRKEDPRLITGQGTYVEDVTLTGMLHMVLVRSPLAHALIKSIDASEACAADSAKTATTASPTYLTRSTARGG